MTRVLRKLVKWFYLLLAIALILLAVMVQSGRSFSHFVSGYNQNIAHYLSQRLNAEVTLGHISADWDGLKPSLEIHNLSIKNLQQKSILEIKQARLRLDMISSLLSARLVWSNLSVQQMQLNFVQNPLGKWHLSGLPYANETAQPKEHVKLDALLDMLLLSRRIEFQASHFSFRFASDQVLNLDAPLVFLENQSDFHRLRLQVDVDEKPRSLYLLLEGRGDPRDSEGFHTQGYLQLNQFPTSEPVAAASAFLLGGVDKPRLKSQGELNATLWFSSRAEGDGLDVQGDVAIERVLVPLRNRQLALDGIGAQLKGHWLRSGAWDLQLQDINTEVQQQKIEGINLSAGSVGFKQPLNLRMQQLDVAHITQLLNDAGTLGKGKLQRILQTLNPRGQLKNMHLTLPLDEPKKWLLRANTDQMAVDPWRGVPGITGVDAYIEVGQDGGFANIDTQVNASLFFNPTYKAPMVFDHMHGQVAWKLLPEKNQVYVNSGPLSFQQGDEQLKAYMWLALPWRPKSGDVDLYLDIGGHNLGVTQYQKYTPALIPQSLSDWLARSLGAQNKGRATTAGFVYRGTLNNPLHAMRSYQLYLDVADAELNYHPDWPALDQLKGRLLLDDANAFALIEQAGVYDSRVSVAQLSVTPSESGQGSVLRLQGRVKGPAGDGLRLLRESALRQVLGSSMESWALLGELDTGLTLTVPVGVNKPVPQEQYQQVNMELTAGQLNLHNLNLELRDLEGRLQYESGLGLSATQLTAALFDQPVSIDIRSEPHVKGQSKTLVAVEGAVDSTRLAGWSKRPELLFLQGLMPYKATVELRHGVVAGPAVDENEVLVAKVATSFADDAFASVSVNADLSSVAIDLPAPYGKPAKQQGALNFTLWLQQQQAQIQLDYADKLQARMLLDRATEGASELSLLNANIALGAAAALPVIPELLITGALTEFDLESWTGVFVRYENYRKNLNVTAVNTEIAPIESDPRLVAGLPFRAELRLGHYEIGALSLKDLDVNVARGDKAWQLHLNNDQILGDIHVPYSSNDPLQLKLQRLALTRSALGMTQDASLTDAPNDTAVATAEIPDTEKPLQLASLDPRQLPLANLEIDALSFDGASYGNWSLQLRPNQKGVVFENIRGSIRGLKVAALDDDLGGAQLIWQASAPGAYTSRFIGSLSTTDIGQVLREWEKPDTIESKVARYDADLYWAGSPQDFALVNLNGSMTIGMKTGRFKRDATAGDGILRLMSILNFDSLARRMRLDFSDLYQSGLAYDEINGKVRFDQGVMVFDEPLVVRTPSSGLQMAGSIDLREETLNTRLVATLPVAGNLTFFTALATGLPAAAGIYLVSKLFKKQVDQATSLTYSIEGTWDKPIMRFDRLFESEQSLRESVKSSADAPEEADIKTE